MAASHESVSPPNPYSLFGITFARFCETFGEPNLVAGKDYQWSLKTSPFGNDIHILIDGPREKPVVWIFDPNDRADGVSRSIIDHEDGISDIVEHIRDRVAKAARIYRKVREPESEQQ